MAHDQPAGTRNVISGGSQYGPVLQAQTINATFQAAAAAPMALAQLPALVASFTGRDAEMAVLTGLLDPAGPVVVLAVAGLAGVGKTTLAMEAGRAALRRGWFGGGVLFVDLHGYDESPIQPGQALDALLRALGVLAEHIPSEVEERAGLYRSVLAQVSGPVLVIADNVSSEAQVQPLLPGTGPHKLLVTSRSTLAGLDARLVDVTILDNADSVVLLNAALRIARPGDDRISGDREAAGRLAEVCGGLPLALQITAALLKADPALSAGELADELKVEQGRLDQLAYDDGSGTAAPSVAVAFELSYRRLEETSARVFRLLPINPGPDVSAAAAAILADLPVTEVRGVLAGLARAHLVEATPGAGSRWRMHDLMRLYAQQLSDNHASADDRERARDRLLGYYLSTARAADDHLRALPGTAVSKEFTGRAGALDWLDAEQASLAATVQMAAESGRDQVALRLAMALDEYFGRRLRSDDRLASITIGLAAARRLGDRDGEGAALLALGLALQSTRRFEEAIAACQDAARFFRRNRDKFGKGAALNNLGLALRQVRRFDEAIAAHQQAIQIFRKIHNRHDEGLALISLGVDQTMVREFYEAANAFHSAALIFHEAGDKGSRGNALTELGTALHEMRRFDEAIATHQRAVQDFRETGDEPGEGVALTNLGIALAQAGRFEEAITAHQQATRISQETSDKHGEAMTLDALGIALTGASRFDEAIAAHQQVIQNPPGGRRQARRSSFIEQSRERPAGGTKVRRSHSRLAGGRSDSPRHGRLLR